MDNDMRPPLWHHAEELTALNTLGALPLSPPSRRAPGRHRSVTVSADSPCPGRQVAGIIEQVAFSDWTLHVL